MLEELKQYYWFQELLYRLEIEIELDKLRFAKGATYDSYRDDHVSYYRRTRVDLLHNTHDRQIDIFQTMAGCVAGRGRFGGVILAACFFLARDERGRAYLYFDDE